MRSFDYKKHVINKVVELMKFIFTLGLLYFLVIKLPGEASAIVKYAGAFILGGSRLRSRLGL